MNVLVCGGAGYIGSHAVRELLKAGHFAVVLDNLSRGHRVAVGGASFVEGDIADRELLGGLIRRQGIEACMHFAAHSLVGESVGRPDMYYFNNVVKGITLLDACVQAGVRYFVFSSLAFKGALRWYGEAFGLKYASPRYFNAAGADPAGDIGEDHDPETHLIPLVLKAASGKLPGISVFGNDYPTPDGTCVRDYIHVTDLARAHLLALDYLRSGMPSDCFNLGNGSGYSVLEVIKTAEEVTGRPIEVKYAARRPGDHAVLVAGAGKAQKVLGWRSQFNDLKTIIETAWIWHRDHPDGFGGQHVQISGSR